LGHGLRSSGWCALFPGLRPRPLQVLTHRARLDCFAASRLPLSGWCGRTLGRWVLSCGLAVVDICVSMWSRVTARAYGLRGDCASPRLCPPLWSLPTLFLCFSFLSALATGPLWNRVALWEGCGDWSRSPTRSSSAPSAWPGTRVIGQSPLTRLQTIGYCSVQTSPVSSLMCHADRPLLHTDVGSSALCQSLSPSLSPPRQH
jgi:hypothetical protein